HEMLQREAWHRGGEQLFVDAESRIETVREACLLHGEILAHQIELVGKRHFAGARAAERAAQHIAQMLDDGCRPRRVVVAHEHRDGVQAVEQEVRIELRLERRELRSGQLLGHPSQLRFAIARLAEVADRVLDADHREIHRRAERQRRENPAGVPVREAPVELAARDQGAEHRAGRRPRNAKQKRHGEMPRDVALPRLSHERPTRRQSENQRRERAVHQPIDAREQHRAPLERPTPYRVLANRIDGAEDGGNDPGGGDDHPGLYAARHFHAAMLRAARARRNAVYGTARTVRRMPVADDGYEAQHLSLLRRSVAVGATSAAGVTTREAGLTTYSADTAPSRASSRIGSIDVVRGLIMVLMAIDHVRVYSGVPAGGPTPGVFFTRWVTHFCAPGFAFFAGTSAFLYGRKRDPSTLARFLVERGPILVALELTYLHVAWTFGFNFSTMLAGVIWMLGWCMVILAAFVRLSPATVGGIGVGIMALQTLMRPLAQAFPAAKVVWQFLYLGGGAHVGVDVIVLYNIIPWIGVMMAGYGFGAIMVREPADRDRWCLQIGVTMTALFLVVGSF